MQEMSEKQISSVAEVEDKDNLRASCPPLSRSSVTLSKKNESELYSSNISEAKSEIIEEKSSIK